MHVRDDQERVRIERLHDDHATALWRYCMRLTGHDRARSEDVVQQTFMAAYRVLSKGTELEHPRAWLYHVTRNNALTAVRNRGPAGIDADLAEERLGAIGTGSICKLVHNTISAITSQAITELFTLGVKAGADPKALWETTRRGAFGRNLIAAASGYFACRQTDKACDRRDTYPAPWRYPVMFIGELEEKGCAYENGNNAGD